MRPFPKLRELKFPYSLKPLLSHSPIYVFPYSFHSLFPLPLHPYFLFPLLLSCSQGALNFSEIIPQKEKQRILVENLTGTRSCEEGIFTTFVLKSESDQTRRILEPHQSDTAYIDLQENGLLEAEVFESRTGIPVANNSITYSIPVDDPNFLTKERIIRFCTPGIVEFVNF